MSNIISTFPSGSEDKLKKSGGIMTGALTLSGAPTGNLHAATKQYGTVSPLITYTSNQEEYNNITGATADSTAHTITFTASKKPTGNIGIII